MARKKAVNPKNKGGAPVTYDIGDIKTHLKEYLQSCIKINKAPSIKDFTTVYKYYNKLESFIPSYRRMMELQAEDKELSHILALLKDTREVTLMEGGYNGKLNANLVKFELSAHKNYRNDYTPNSEVTIKTKDEFDHLPLAEKLKIQKILDDNKKA